MTLPKKLTDILTNVGQAAVEVESCVDGFREFVTLFRCPTDQIIGFEGRFPYLVGNHVVYRLMRFRVNSSIIENDRQCSNEDLIGLQSIYVATQEDVLKILQIWHVSPDTLRQPRDTEVPV